METKQLDSMTDTEVESLLGELSAEYRALDYVKLLAGSGISREDRIRYEEETDRAYQLDIAMLSGELRVRNAIRAMEIEADPWFGA